MTDTTTETPEEKHHFPCGQCGGDLEYSPGEARLVCPHCGNEEIIEETVDRDDALRELDYQRALSNQMADSEYEETRVVTCPNCGAQTEFSEEEQAGRCPFCDTPVVTDTGVHRHIKPAALLPFTVEERDARASMTKWLGRLWFAPNGLKEYARKGRAMNGVYVPYWTYDTQTESQYRGARGEHYWVSKTVTRNGKRQTVRERKTRWYPASGRTARAFDDVLILASHSLPKRYTDGLAPWDLSLLKGYQPEFLAGFRAEGYQVELVDGYGEAREKMDAVIRQDVKRSIGGDAQRIHDIDSKYWDITFKHILLPVWLAAYKYRGKTYRFVVNGRSGKVQGERPYSAWKIAFAVLIGLIIAGGIGYVAYLNQ